VFVGSFDQLACLDADEGDEVGCVDRSPAGCADSMSLNAMASPAARKPGPLVTFGAVAHGGEGGLDGVGGAQVDPVLGGIVEEREQFVPVSSQ